jgi:hypothetical protein
MRNKAAMMILAMVPALTGCDDGGDPEASPDGGTSSQAMAEPRVEGRYLLKSGVAFNVFWFDVDPSCGDGPCDVAVSYDFPMVTGHGTLKFDGTSYDGVIRERHTCLVDGEPTGPTVTGQAHVRIDASGDDGAPVADEIRGDWESIDRQKVPRRFRGDFCDQLLPTTAFFAVRQ